MVIKIVKRIKTNLTQKEDKLFSLNEFLNNEKFFDRVDNLYYAIVRLNS